jgi:hypothetical protein
LLSRGVVGSANQPAKTGCSTTGRDSTNPCQTGSPTYPKTGAIISNAPTDLIHHLGTEWLKFAHTSRMWFRKQPNRVPRLQLAGFCNPTVKQVPKPILGHGALFQQPCNGFDPPLGHGMVASLPHQQNCVARKQPNQVPRPQLVGIQLILCQTGSPTYPKTGAIISNSPKFDSPLKYRMASHWPPAEL